MAFRRKPGTGDGGNGSGRPRAPMPKWMFETRTEQWHQAGLGEQLQSRKHERTWLRLILFGLLTAGVLVAFNHRRTIAPGYGTEARILTAVLLFAFGLGFAGALGRTITPVFLRRMDPGTAGTISFAIRLLTVLVIGVIALGIAGVKPATLAVGGAFTAVIVGLASQQALGSIFAGIVLQANRPFQVGQRVRLTGAPLAGSIEGTVSSAGLSYTTLMRGPERALIPNSVLLNVMVEPLRSPDGVDLRARFDSHVTPAEVQDMLSHAITVPVTEAPEIWLEEVDRDEVVYRITATPMRPSDGQKLAEQVVSVTRGTFEYPRPAGSTEEPPEPEVRTVEER